MPFEKIDLCDLFDSLNSLIKEDQFTKNWMQLNCQPDLLNSHQLATHFHFVPPSIPYYAPYNENTRQRIDDLLPEVASVLFAEFDLT